MNISAYEHILSASRGNTAFISADAEGAIAPLLIVFIILTVLLTAFIIVLFASKKVRSYFFDRDTGTSAEKRRRSKLSRARTEQEKSHIRAEEARSKMAAREESKTAARDEQRTHERDERHAHSHRHEHEQERREKTQAQAQPQVPTVKLPPQKPQARTEQITQQRQPAYTRDNANAKAQTPPTQQRPQPVQPQQQKPQPTAQKPPQQKPPVEKEKHIPIYDNVQTVVLPKTEVERRKEEIARRKEALNRKDYGDRK